MSSYDGGATSSRNHYHDPPSLSDRLLRTVQSAVSSPPAQLAGQGMQTFGRAAAQSARKRAARFTFRSLLSLTTALTVYWIFILLRGERWAFAESVRDCEWSRWEDWPEDATPHRLVFIADPQLVDPHTYPGRPWPLSTLTVKYTDQYLRRSYTELQKSLTPDTVIFLGDLFDGGREWSTRSSTSPEEQYRQYGDSFWLKEYARFGKIFFEHFKDGGLLPHAGQPGRKIIAGLPGNHDLGFSVGIQEPVRDRFNAYFGDGNRVDVLGNHTFVSVDTVSLSARGHGDDALWKPAMEFLEGMKDTKKRAVLRELRRQHGLNPNPKYRHGLVRAEDLPIAHLPKFKEEVTDLPTVLLTHVPLYRPENTPCGPLREHWPPTPPPKGQKEPLESDPRNAIAVRGGYQYQNVLEVEISRLLAEKIGNVGHAFSGDDHDYCEVVHRNYPSAGGGIREITVKSLSWAMGVRKPGFVMVSLWNPVDVQGNPLLPQGSKTMQTHLCLMPDQLGTFIKYAKTLLLSLALVAIKAALVASGRLKRSASSPNSPILPISESATSAEKEKADLYNTNNNNGRGTDADGVSQRSTSTADMKNVANRSSAARPRSMSPANGYGLPAHQARHSYPLIQHAGYFGPADRGAERRPVEVRLVERKLGKVGMFLRELKEGILGVAVPVLIVYFWLICRY